MPGQLENRALWYLHLVADATTADPIRGPGSRPQVRKALDGQRVATIPVTGNLEVQITVICGKTRSAHIQSADVCSHGSMEKRCRPPTRLKDSTIPPSSELSSGHNWTHVTGEEDSESVLRS